MAKLAGAIEPNQKNVGDCTAGKDLYLVKNMFKQMKPKSRSG